MAEIDTKFRGTMNKIASETPEAALSDERLRKIRALREVSRSYPVGERMMQEHPGGSYVTIIDYNQALDMLIPYAEELLRIASDLGEPADPFAAWEHIGPELLARRTHEAADFECENCLGMGASNGCYCDAMGAEKPGGPMSTDAAMDRATQIRARGNLLLAAAERLEQEAYDRAAKRGEHTGTDGI